jgi:hypothetical protein
MSGPRCTVDPRRRHSDAGAYKIEPARRLLRADLPDHARVGDLHKGGIGGVLELGVGVGLSEISDRAVIGNIGTIIGAKPDVCRTVKASDSADESLLERLVLGKSLKIESQWLLRLLREIEQLDLVSRLRRRRAGVRR